MHARYAGRDFGDERQAFLVAGVSSSSSQIYNRQKLLLLLITATTSSFQPQPYPQRLAIGTADRNLFVIND